jgi:hypothetical protein
MVYNAINARLISMAYGTRPDPINRNGARFIRLKLGSNLALKV